MLHKNMESELEDLCHELKALKKERKELEKKIRGMKTLRSTGRLDSPTKELLNRARKIWSGIISEGGKDEARQVSVKKQKSLRKTSTFVLEKMIFSNPTQSHTHTLGKQLTTIKCPDTLPTLSMTYLEMYHVA